MDKKTREIVGILHSNVVGVVMEGGRVHPRCIQVLQRDFVLRCTLLRLHQGTCSTCAGGDGWQRFGKGASQAGFASAPAQPRGGLG